MKKTNNMKNAITALLIAASAGITSAQVILTDGQVLSDGGVVNIFNSDGSAFNGNLSGDDGLSFLQSNGIQILISGGASPDYEITISSITGAGANGAPYTWNGVGASEDTSEVISFTGNGGTWTDNTTFNFSEAITINGSTLSGAANGDDNASRISFSEDWGSVVLSGTTGLTYSSQVDSGQDGFRFEVTAIPEPSSTALLGLGGLALLARRRRA